MSGPGIHLSLSRDDAKRLFSCRGDEAVRTFVAEFARSDENRRQRLVHDSGDAWDAIHRCLTDGTLDPNAGELPLNHCILGGRQMYYGDDYFVALVRPDLTRHVSDALAALDKSDFQERYGRLDPQQCAHQTTDEEFQRIWSALESIGRFFESAAANGHAVVFAAER